MQLGARLRRGRGFSLVEIAVVAFIVALLLGGVILTLSAQEEQRANAEAQRRLDAAVEAVLGFAVVNRRLPCPAVTGVGKTGIEDPPGGGTCTTNFAGFLPALSVGYSPVDSLGYGLDPWGNRIRYAVASAVTGCTGPTLPHFTSMANLKANGVSCRPSDLVVCASSSVITGTSCGTAPAVTNQDVVGFLVLSTGKNGAVAATYGADEQPNVDGNQVFVSRIRGTAEEATGAYDDLMVWVPASVLYSKLISAGVLP